MKRPACFLVALCVIFSGVHGFAEPTEMYVIDVIKLGVRNNPNPKDKSIHIIQSGNAVKVLERKNGWARINVDDRYEGWVLQKYLTAEAPLLFRYQKLAALKQQQESELDNLKNHNQQLEDDRQRMGQEIEALRQQLLESAQNPPSDHDQDSAYQTLKAEYERLEAELTELRETPRASTGLFDLSHRDYLFFITGAAVLLLGMLLGYVGKRKRRQTFLG